MELFWVQTNQMVISRSASAYGYFLAMHSRLVNVTRIFLSSVGLRLILMALNTI